MPWNDLANNQTISFTNLKDSVDTGVFAQKTTVPVSNEQITKSEADTYVWIDNSFGPYASKTSNQLVVKSNLQCAVPVTNTTNLEWWGIANNETTSSPIQLIVGQNNNADGRIFKSTDYGANYSSVLLINDFLRGIKFAPNFRHASYLTVTPFVAVGEGGRIVTNSVQDATSWITISSPTVQNLFDCSFNLLGRGVIVGLNRILRTNTDYRINAWSIVNSVGAAWTSVANDGYNFVAVGLNDSVITAGPLATTWTVRSMPPLSPLGIDLYAVTYHTDGYFYAVGNGSGAVGAYIMRSSDQGVNWSAYVPTGYDLFTSVLFSIESINGRLVIGGINYQYQIRDNVVTRCGATSGGVEIIWNDIVKDAATSSGFDMAGEGRFGPSGAYSNF
jgi:hypothetical protein